MEDRKYLNEENYQRGKKKLTLVGIIIIIAGLLLGGSLIAAGISNSKQVGNIYSEENKQVKIENLKKQIADEKASLESKKEELKAKGVVESSSYENGEAYDLYIITHALNPSFDYCAFDEYKNNLLTSNYCSLKEQLDDAQTMDVDFEREWNNFDSIGFYIIGGFIIFSTLSSAGVILLIAKRREIAAFTTQQVMPVAKEGIEEISPSIGKAVKDISKGIAEGIEESKNK